MPSFGEFARGVGRGLLNTAQGVGRAVGAIPRQIGYELGQYGQGLRNVASGDFAGAAQNFMNTQGAPVMRDAFMSAFNDDPSGSVVGRGYIGGSGRGGGASRAGRDGAPAVGGFGNSERGSGGASRARGEDAPAVGSFESSRRGGGASRARREGAPAVGLLRGRGRSDAGPTGRYGGSARLGTGQGLESSRHAMDMIERQQRRPDQER